MSQQSKLNSIIFPLLFAVSIILPFTYTLLKQFYFYEAVVVGLILLPILLIPLLYFPRRTLLALLILSISVNPSFAIVRNNSFVFPLSIKFWLSDLVLIFSWCFIFLRKLNDRFEHSMLIYRSTEWILIFFVLWIIFGMLSMVFAVNKTVVIIELVKMVRVFLIYLTIPYLVKSKSDLVFIAICLVGAIFLQTLLIMVQYATGEQVVRLPGGSRDLDITAAETLFRPGGTLGHSSNYAKLSALILPSCLVLQQYYPRSFGRKIFGLALVFIFIATVIVVSRIGFATSVLGIVLMLYLTLKTVKGRRTLLWTLFSCFLAISLAWFVGGERIVDRMTYDYHSAEARIPMMLTALKVIKAHPLGVGLNNYLYVAPQYDDYGIIDLFPFPVHNIFLLNFAELGMVGGACFLCLLAVVVLFAFRASWRTKDEFDAMLLKALGVGILCSWLQGLVGWGHRASFIHLPYFAVLAGAMVAYNSLVLMDENK